MFSSFIKFTSLGYFFYSSKSKNNVLSSIAVFVAILYCIELIQLNSWNLLTLFSFKLGIRVTSTDNLAVTSSLNIKSSIGYFTVSVFQFYKFTTLGYFFYSSKSKNHVLSTFAVFVAILYCIELMNSIQPNSWNLMTLII